MRNFKAGTLILCVMAACAAPIPATADTLGTVTEAPPPAKPKRAAVKPATPAPAAPAAKSDTQPRKVAEPAPKPKTALQEGPLRVQVVRSALPGCEPNCLEWISVEGRIDVAGRIKLAKVVATLGQRKLPIFIDSAGGSGDDGIAMGRLARKSGLDVVVAKTVFEPCAAGDAACRKLEVSGTKRGQVSTQTSKCMSACAFVLAGGVRRIAGPTSHVGLHDVASYSTMSMVRTRYRVVQPLFGQAQKQILSREVLSSKRVRTATADSTYTNIAGFFSQMGISSTVMDIIHQTPHESIYILSPIELYRTKLATQQVAARTLETAVQHASAEAPAAATAPAAAAPVLLGATAAPALASPGVATGAPPPGLVPPGTGSPLWPCATDSSKCGSKPR